MYVFRKISAERPITMKVKSHISILENYTIAHFCMMSKTSQVTHMNLSKQKSHC